MQARILGHDVTYKLGAPGRHVVQNSLAVLAAAALAGADLALSALALAELAPPTGRGARQTLEVPGGQALLIDESYNANPASMRAALALLGQAPIGPRGRRIAVLGEMLELGAQGVELHSGLAAPIAEHSVDLVFCAGPLYRGLWEALPSGRKGGYADTSASLEAAGAGRGAGRRRGDDQRLARVENGTHRKGAGSSIFPARRPPGGRRSRLKCHKVDPMLYWLADFSSTLSFFNVFRYLTVRTAGSLITALVFVFMFGPWIIDHLRLRQGKGQPIRADGPKSHIIAKAGTPTMGGLMILLGIVVSTVLWANPRNPYVWIVLAVTLGFGLVGFYDDYLKVTRQTHGGFAGKMRLADRGDDRACGLLRLRKPRPRDRSPPR